MTTVRVVISRFVSDVPQPGTVEAVLTDIEGKEHKIIDKVPIFSAESLTAKDEYPKDGVVSCQILERWIDCITINTEKPDGVESEEHITVFRVSPQLIIESDKTSTLNA